MVTLIAQATLDKSRFFLARAREVPVGDREVFKHFLEAAVIAAELDEVTGQRSAAAFDQRRHTLSQKEIEALKARARDFPARMGEASLSTARRLLGEWLDTIVIDGDARRVTVSIWPVPSLAKSSPARLAQGRRCWLAASPRFSRR